MISSNFCIGSNFDQRIELQQVVYVSYVTRGRQTIKTSLTVIVNKRPVEFNAFDPDLSSHIDQLSSMHTFEQAEELHVPVGVYATRKRIPVRFSHFLSHLARPTSFGMEFAFEPQNAQHV